MTTKFNYKKIYISLKDDIEKNRIGYGTMLPTESDLAEKYAVSRPTVAKAYNLLQQEGYVEKRIGSGTRAIYNAKSKVYMLGLLLPGAGESEIFSMINNRLMEQEKSGKFNYLWEGATAGRAEIRKKMVEIHCEKYINEKVDGILFSPLERICNAQKLNLNICERIRDANIPLVLIDRDIANFPDRSSFDMVGLDNYNAGYRMGQHLIDQKAELIYFFQRPESASSLILRLAGMRAAVQDAGLKFGNENILIGDPDNLEFIKNIKIIFQKTAILCANDATAAVLMSSLEKFGITVGRDIIISGFDDMKYANHLKHSLTSYKQPCEAIADTSLELIYRRIENKDATPPLTVSLIGEIIERDSTKFLY